MVWLRKGFVWVLSLVLLGSLIGLALAVSGVVNLTHPQKLEAWLNQSNFYSSLVTNELHDAQQSASNDLGAGRVSLSDPTVVKAVQSVFSPQLLQGYTTTFLNSNYAWLEGKDATPQFTIDLRPAKQQLAQQVGQAVQARLSGLSTCSAAQLTQLQATLTSDPLAISCLLPTLSAQTAAKQATTQINGSSDFLNNPVITPNALNPNGNNQRQPYYQRLSAAPKAYKWAERSPWILGALIVLSGLGILFMASSKRRGIRRIGSAILVAGLVLVAVKLVADAAMNRAEKHIFNSLNVGQLQQSLTNFLHQLETQLVRVDLWFALAFLIIGVLVLAVLRLTHHRPNKKHDFDNFGNPPDASPRDERPPLPALKPSPRPNPQRPRPPRLIQ